MSDPSNANEVILGVDGGDPAVPTYDRPDFRQYLKNGPAGDYLRDTQESLRSMMPDNGSRPDSGAVDGSSSKADGGFDPPDAGTSSSAAPVVGFDSPDATASVDSSSSSTVNPNPDDNPFSEASDSVQPGFNDLMSNY